LSNEDNVLGVLIGSYSALGNSDLFGGEILRNSELLAADGEIVFTGTFNEPSEIWRKEILTANADVSEAWLDGYNTINIVNNVLKAIDDGVVKNDVDIARGQALFIRGLVYFELVKFFGLPYSDGNAASNPGVPLVLEPTSGIDDGSFVARSTVQQVYQQVVTDLTTAAGLLSPTDGEFANSVAAYAVLARAYLQMGDYANALTATNNALSEASGNYAILPDYADAFNRDANSFEDVFSMQVTTTDGTNAMQLFYAERPLGGRGDIEVEQRHADFYDPADLRLAFHYLDQTTNEIRTGKWQNQFGNVGAIRLAELYLNRAECNFRISGASSSVDDDINLIRNRAGLGDIAVTNLNQIFLERKLELAHEGHAIHDFKRTQGAFYRLEPAFGAVDTSGDGLVDGFAYNDNALVYPIPDREIQANNKLTQNPGYGN
jgi:tetratricopeptide (TPR) repeat protein